MRKLLLLFTALVVTMLSFPMGTASAEYTIGIVGYGNRVKHTNIPDAALEQAQNIFLDIMSTELAGVKGITTVDPSERATQARIDEMCFQLENGNPEKVITNFSVHPDYLLYGYLANLTITRRESLASQNLTVRADFTARVVDAKTKQVVAVASGTGIAESHGENIASSATAFGEDEISRQSWHDSVEKALTEIGEKLRKKI